MGNTWRAALAAALIAAAGLAGAANRFDELATRDAQRAMFSMPAVVTEGIGPEAPPTGFDGENADEAALIAYFGDAQRRGADLNAVVHLGTPLHHALRAGLDRTAQWLLGHGADPLLRTVEPTADSTGRDALELAVAYGRWSVLPALRHHPAVAALPTTEREQRFWRAALATPGRATELLDRREPVPRFAGPQGGGLAQTLLTHGLCSGQLRLVQALLQADATARPVPTPAPPQAPLCPGWAAAPAGTAALPVAHWVALEQRMGWPLLPYALRQVAGEADARALLAAPLARPWAQPGFARPVVAEVLARRQSALLPLLHAMPPASLQVEVQGALAEWAVAAADWPRDELTWALTQVNPVALTAAMGDVARRWDGDSALAGRSAKDARERDERWRLLSQRLAGPPPATVSPLFLYGVPLAVWSRWFELGFRVAARDWADWLQWAEPQALRAAWPLVAPVHPMLARRSLTWLVAPLSAGPIADDEAARLSYDGSRCCWPLESARFLAAQGLMVQPVRPLAGAFRPQPAQEQGAPARSDLADDEAVRAALQAGWVLPPLPAARLALAPTRCQPRMTPALRRALAAPIRVEEGTEPTVIDPATLQWIDAPQGDECVFFVNNEGGGGRLYIDDESFDSGVNRLTPCPDNQRRVLVWRPRAAAWRALDWLGQGDVSQVRLPGGGVGLVQHEMEFGTCGLQQGRALSLLRAPDGDGWHWAPAPAADALAQWLMQHCELRSLTENCLDPALSASVDAGAPAVAPLDRLLAADKADFLAAVDAMDRTALAAALQAGVFPRWVQSAIERMSGNGTLALEDRRRRMAWLLARHEALPGLGQPVLERLVSWLPTEDWAPLQRFRLCAGDGVNDQLADLAKTRGRVDLERRLRAASGRRCGD